MTLSYRQILVDSSPTGLRGLDEVFEILRAAGHKPGDAGLGVEIVKQMNQENYIPPSARAIFAVAFEREYATYVAQMESGGPVRKQGYGM